MLFRVLRKKVSGQVVVTSGDFSSQRPWASEELLWEGGADSSEAALRKAKEEGALKGIPETLLPLYT